MFNETVSRDILPSLNMTCKTYCITNTEQTSENIYVSYISVTQKVLKSCQSKMATWAHAACDVHRASLYIETCWQSSFIMHMYNRVLPTEGMGSPPYQPKICSFPPHPPPPTNFLFSSHQKSIFPTPSH